jgi:hypothetical protein
MDLILAENDNNLELKNFDLQVLGGSIYVANKIRIALRTFHNEWFLNINAGLPYYEDILIKNPNLDFVSDLYQSEILSISEVDSLDEFTLSLNATRQLDIFFIAILTDGTTVEITEVI